MSKTKNMFLIGILIFIFGFSPVSAQKNPVFYAGFEYYRQSSFENNSFGNFNVGAQIYQIKFFAPEIGFDFYGGSLEERNIHNRSEKPQINSGLFRQGFSASVLTFNPKLKFGKEDAFITFSPKYHTGYVKAKGDYLELTSDNRYFKLEESQEIKNPVSFWSFAIGFEGLEITNRYWFAVSLHYTTVDANLWDQLDFSEYGVNTYSANTASIGFGIRFYYNPFSSEND